MQARQLFERVRASWPDFIILKSDASSSEGDAIWSVVHCYDSLEPKFADDDWLSIGAWSFHQALTDLARLKIQSGLQTVRPADVSFEAFDSNMRDNLADDAWAGACQ
ncbi:hypothetical protein GCM10011349_47980 [Novosphingobium indicum]|uniref:Uncharacterized protein n=1 Tax=Novosphingobium indicum TaxID=462949 RepID=A0ABQ2K3L4_9SPHN|nr:hypothetical protein GCM10011349_47980 [Novosphingobium indicum]